MILMDEMVPLRLYSSKLRAYIPFNPANKKKGAMITLLTNGVDDSIQLINMPYIHNPNYFISYYLNRNVKYFLTKNGNVTIEDEDEDEGEEAVQEAVLHTFKPSNPQFDSEGSSHDLKLLSDNFAKKKFDKWYDYFRIKKEKRIYPTVYGFNTLASMAKAISDKAIMDDGKLILNSYNTAMEIFVPNGSEYTIKNADGPYEMYCENAIITYVVDTQFNNASWYLANQVGTALSGAADYLYQKNNFKTDDKMSAAIMISRFEKEYGRSEIIDLCRTGNYTKLAKLGARDFIARVKPIFQKPKHETAIQESILLPQKDAMYNMEDWRDGKNIMFILGLSGSGKSTLARQLADDFDDAYKVELDRFCDYHPDYPRSDSNFSNRMVNEFAKANKITKPVSDIPDNEFDKWMIKFIDFVCEYAKKHPNDLFILEGIQLARYAEQRSWVLKYPFVVKGTSMAKSMMNRASRSKGFNDLKVYGQDNEKPTLKDLVRLFKFYTKGERDINAVREKLKKANKEAAIQESDGTHGDVMRVYKAMNATDQRFISSDGSYQTASDNNVCYRHIEREGFLTTKGFVECFRDFDDIASVVIGVHPKFRGEGLASKMMEQMLKDFPKENPEINELVWRADAKNKKSRKLAEKFGFKLIRESNIQAVYRYEFKPSHKYDDIPDEILSDKDLIKWVKKNLSLDTSYVTKSTKLMSIKDIIHKKNVRQVDVAYFCYKAIQKMSLDCVFCLYTEHSDENSMQVNFGDIHAAVVYWYTPDTLILMDPLNDTLKLGYGVIKRDAMLEYQIKLHEAYKWGDINTYPYIIEYVPFDADIQPGKLIYKDIFKIDTLAQKSSLRKYSLLEFSTTSKLSPPEMRNNQIQMNLQRLINVKIDDEVIEKYGTLMPCLHHLRTTNNCTGYLFLDPNSKPKKDRPVCYYNVQRKKDENYGEVVWLQGIEVDEDYQGRGLAKQLLQMAIANDGVTNLAVNKNNEVAYRLYTSMGFRQYNINGSMINMQLPKKKLKEVHIDRMDDNMLMFENQVVIFTEALSQKSYDQRLKQYLFKQRLRNSSMQISLYNQVKDACPVIRKAFVSPAMYNGLNLFVDLGYYNKLFLQNNTTVKDIAIQFYWDFVNRLIDNAIEPEYRSRYSKNTIFIPVWSNAWPVQPNSYVYDWKVNLNPISMIFRMLRRNPAELKNKWGKLDVVFIGKTGYFKVNFKTFELKNLTKFKVRLEKLWRGELIDRDPDEDGYQYGSSELSADRDSTSAIAVKVIDKIEDSTGIEVNNVSSAITTNDASAMPKVDGSADPVIFPNMRIRNTTINTTGVCSIGILAPSEDNIVDTISHNDVLRLAYTSHLDYFSL